jgi:hypothetical protein
VRVLVIRPILAAERVVAAHVVGHLHLDDVGAPIGKLPARRRAGADLREVDHPKALQGRGRGLMRHRRSALVG